MVYEFGAFALDARARTVTLDGRLVLLTPKAVDTLLALVEQQGRVVTRAQMLEAVWPGQFVEDGVLSVNVALLRKALEAAGLPREAIETVPRRGYRFVPDVRRVALPAPPARESVSPVARRLYLEGRHFWAKRTETALAKAAECFEAAVAEDPDYARAHAGLADTYLGIGILPPADAMPRAKAAAQRAIALDPTLGEAYASLGRVLMAFEWDWDGAGRAFGRAIGLSPQYATAHQWYANWLAATGRTNDAVVRIREAQQIDPISLSVSAGAGFLLYMARRFDEAVTEYQRVIEMDGTFAVGYREMAMVLAQLQRHQDALTAIDRALAFGPANAVTAALRAQILALAGDRRGARAQLAQLASRADDIHLLPQLFAATSVALGEWDAAWRWLRLALERRCYTLIWLKVDPWFDAVRTDARFAASLTRIGLA